MTIRVEIGRMVRKLKAKAQRNGVHENFGQKEVQQLKDKYHYSSLIYGSPGERSIAKQIDHFNDWCMNYTGR